MCSEQRQARRVRRVGRRVCLWRLVQWMRPLPYWPRIA
jgi:hypothetical protein